MVSRLVLVLVLGSVAAGPAFSQPELPSSPAAPDIEQEVRATIEALFDAMRAGDSSAVRETFVEEARLQTALEPDETPSVQSTSIDRFVEAVGQPRDEVWDERTWDVEVQVDGPLASAWVPYAFYRGEELSHCGVNAIQLVQQPDGWRILQITDTRREECEVPEDVQK